MSPETVCFLHNPAMCQRRARRAARSLGWERKTLYRVGKDSVDCFRTRKNRSLSPRVLVSAGIHGDEPAGVEAVLQWMEEGGRWMESFTFTVLPCLNPWGLRQNCRCNEEGIDLNRAFLRKDLPLIQEVCRLYESCGPFELALLLHEDYDACGIYLYETAGSLPSWGQEILEKASVHCPIDVRKRIEGRLHNNGVLRRPLRWQRFLTIGMPEAVYLYRCGCQRVYTMETPSEWDITLRVRAHRAFLDAALCLLYEQSLGQSQTASAQRSCADRGHSLSSMR
jgi:protein MpaA